MSINKNITQFGNIYLIVYFNLYLIMTGIITGDITKSRKSVTRVWIDRLKQILGTMEKSSKAWEIYRGDASS